MFAIIWIAQISTADNANQNTIVHNSIAAVQYI